MCLLADIFPVIADCLCQCVKGPTEAIQRRSIVVVDNRQDSDVRSVFMIQVNPSMNYSLGNDLLRTKHLSKDFA